MSTGYSGVLISREDTDPFPTGVAVGPTQRRVATTERVARPHCKALQPSAPGRKYFKYLPESAGASPRATRVIGLGCSDVLPGECYPPRNHPNLYSYEWRAGRTLPEFQVILLSNALGEFESEATGRVRLVGDVMLFLFPGVWHRYRPLPNGGWNERWVSLHGDAISGRIERAGINPSNAIVAPENTARLRDSFDALIDAVDATSSTCGRGAMPLAFRFFEEAMRQASDEPLAVEEVMMMNDEQIDDEIVRRALEIIWNHQHNPPLGVNDVARMLPVTRRTLDRRFSEALGRTVLDEINACRLSRAKRLLADTDSPVKAVAYLAGFPSRERLRLAFLNHEGVPPSEYRENVRRDRAATGASDV